MKVSSLQEASWPRWTIAALAAFGSALTAYLSWTKLTAAQTAFCTQGAGCDLVLQTPYASLFGLPLSSFGLALYLALLLIALVPGIDRWRWGALFALSLGGVTFTAYLVYLLAFEIVAVCLYCIASALTMTAIFVLTLVGHRWQKPDNLVLGGLGIVLVGMAAIYGIYNVQSAAAGPVDYSVALAKHLRASGAKFYGASWCPHCKAQKSFFGPEALRFVPYVECSPNGQPGSGLTKACADASIESFPTWDIAGQRYMGEQSLEQSARYSNFTPTANTVKKTGK